MRKSISVPDMMCHNCEKKLIGLAGKLTGVNSIVATHETHLMDVDFDENKLTIEQIIIAIHEIGFHPELIPG